MMALPAHVLAVLDDLDRRIADAQRLKAFLVDFYGEATIAEPDSHAVTPQAGEEAHNPTSPAISSTAARKDVQEPAPADGPDGQAVAGTQAPPVDYHSQANASTGNAATADMRESAGDGRSGEASSPSVGGGTDAPIPPETVAQTVPDCMPVLSPPAGVGAVASPALAPAARETLEQAVGRVHADHPEWTAREIAEHIGRPYASVQTTLATVRRRANEKSEPAPPPAQSAMPARSRPDSVVVGKPMSVPKGARFHLRNAAGEYLHGSCEQMTTVRAYAWIGNRDQLEGCRARYPLARDLVPQVADTQQRIAA